jgi:carbamoyltransferase
LDPNKTPDHETLQHLARLLADGKIFAIAIGNGEVGPRALGHRSILCIPSTAEMKTRISIQIKKREYYRPIAPIILDHLAPKVFDPWFDFPANEFMLLEYHVKPNFADMMPAVVHVDGTARAQIIKKTPIWQSFQETAFLYDLLTIMWEEYEIPCLINTSFNIAGKPIVHYKHDALDSAQQMGLDGVLLEDKLHVFKE